MLLSELTDFLKSQPPHLKKLWHSSIGTQLSFTNEVPEDKRELRIPHDGNGKHGEPYFDDTAYHPPLDQLLALGVSGWDWADKRSRYVTFDLDSLLGHVKGLTPERLAEIVDKLKQVPWVEIVKSKGGKGYHVRVYFDPLPIANTHTEHAHNAERALAHLSAVTGIDLQAEVDVCGAIAWLWHRDTSADGFALIKDSTQTLDLSTTPELPRREPANSRRSRSSRARSIGS